MLYPYDVRRYKMIIRCRNIGIDIAIGQDPQTEQEMATAKHYAFIVALGQTAELVPSPVNKN